MKTTIFLFTTIMTLIALLGMSVFAVSAHAGLDVNLGAEVKIWDDEDIYISVSARYYDREPSQVREWEQQCRNSDDLAVALFIARHSGKSPSFVLTLRKEGATWWDISVGLGVEPDVWFVPVKKNPGPPYGKAYGHWKNGKKSPQKMTMSDDDCRNLVTVRVLHDYYGVSVEMAMEWRASGKKLENLTANEYRNRHVRGQKPKKDKSVETASNSGKGKGKGKK